MEHFPYIGRVMQNNWKTNERFLPLDESKQKFDSSIGNYFWMEKISENEEKETRYDDVILRGFDVEGSHNLNRCLGTSRAVTIGPRFQRTDVPPSSMES